MVGLFRFLLVCCCGLNMCAWACSFVFMCVCVCVCACVCVRVPLCVCVGMLGGVEMVHGGVVVEVIVILMVSVLVRGCV